MTSTGNEKEASSLDYREDANFKDAPAQPVIEQVNYGYNGARAWLSSPYVFGAALLASMGGFSYGYGTQALHIKH